VNYTGWIGKGMAGIGLAAMVALYPLNMGQAAVPGVSGSAMAVTQQQGGYVYEAKGLKLVVPEKHNDKLIIKALSAGENGKLFTVSEKKSVEESRLAHMKYDGMGWLFSIGKISEGQLNEMLANDMSGVEIFAKDISGMYYVFYHPTDVRYHRSTIQEMREDQALWTELVQWAGQSVRSDFIKNNPGLVSVTFNNDEVIEQWRSAMKAYKGYNDGQYASSPAWVQKLPEAKASQQMLVVAGVGATTAWVSLHEKDWNGQWRQLMTTPGFIGRNGLGKTKEGDGGTPVGTFGFNAAFGIAPDPGCAIPYQQVDENFYWSGDERPGMRYNEMVDIRQMPDLDKNASEHIVDYNPQYIYCLNISYNDNQVPGKGSAIFLHSFGPNKPYTGGCVALPLDKMEFVMKHVRPDCVVVINDLDKLGGSF
jgi:L,D-peptidoglycan transpeptidase YkuD (ErfK/YbiS/YcfS/YnhG family)